MYWMNLPEEYRKGKFVILPIEFEGSVSYGKGAKNGSKEIIEASKQLEYYDCEFNCEPFEAGIELLNTVKVETAEEMIEKVSENFNNEKFTIALGGDHSVTIGMVKALEKIHDDFSVIILDAHPDFFHSWNGSMNNHRCVSARVSNNHEIALVGIRSMDIDEKTIIDNSENVHLVTDLKEILPKLKQKVYISIDVDVFDPAFIRNTGTPEPGGLGWQEVIDTLKIIFSQKEVIAADIVEFAPQNNFRAEAYSLAKLVYKLIALQYNNAFKESTI